MFPAGTVYLTMYTRACILVLYRLYTQTTVSVELCSSAPKHQKKRQSPAESTRHILSTVMLATVMSSALSSLFSSDDVLVSRFTTAPSPSLLALSATFELNVTQVKA
ncbi:hypothetical protein Bpfe_010419 [Biomphalaria pfeifferi]|uniref:Uncharacterized protein n=1 Tax=Biomphalaria pfeifferi TaxID=112525 RepID=A0AAD8BUC1_BIOPF|nr:hypothetical protein Bpfe_010419 [Biomphalaria pfeifferi]